TQTRSALFGSTTIPLTATPSTGMPLVISVHDMPPSMVRHSVFSKIFPSHVGFSNPKLVTSGFEGASAKAMQPDPSGTPSAVKSESGAHVLVAGLNRNRSWKPRYRLLSWSIWIGESLTFHISGEYGVPPCVLLSGFDGFPQFG